MTHAKVGGVYLAQLLLVVWMVMFSLFFLWNLMEFTVEPSSVYLVFLSMGQIAFCAIWFQYLRKSRRVRLTYFDTGETAAEDSRIETG